MSTTGRTSATAPAASDVASRLTDAGFVRLVGTATGDGLAASGVLARALEALDRPFQMTLAPLTAETARSTDADLTVAIGRADPAADLELPGADCPASETALAVASELGQIPDSSDSAESDGLDTDSLLTLALAGVAADGRVAGSDVAERATEAGIERRPGLAIPTESTADGLAHSTLVHTAVSGDEDAASRWIADHGFDDVDSADDRRRLASLVALDAVGSDDVPPRGGDAVERVLRPYAGGPFETIGGYADVLDAIAREQPGTGIALALGSDLRPDALDAWRRHATGAHATVREAETSRYDGLFVAERDETNARVETAARLLHAYRSPEPVTLVAANGESAVVADDPGIGSSIEAAAAAVGGNAAATGTTGRARYDADAGEFVSAFREALE